MGLLDGKTAVITGCNRGIGLAILDAFCEQGANIYAVIRKENPEFDKHCLELKDKFGCEIKQVYADFTNEDEVKTAAKEILSDKQPIDVLVNNIGYASETRSFLMESTEKMKNTFQINYFSPILFTQCLCKNMIKNSAGSIVFILSTAIYDAFANLSYTSSKSAGVGAVRRLASELGNYGIRVNAVAPSLTNTEMGHLMGEEDEKEAVSRNIMKRKAEPAEIADTTVYMASDMSSFMTGQIIRVDGGML